MSLDRLIHIIEAAHKALNAALVEEGCARLSYDDWARIEEILIAALARTSVLGAGR